MLKMRTLLPKFLPHYFLLAETKLDEGFQNCRFIIDQGLIEYVRQDLIKKSLENTINSNSHTTLSEITIINNNWTIFSVYTFENVTKVVAMVDFNIYTKHKANRTLTSSLIFAIHLILQI